MITPFHGDYKDWLRFWNQFITEVDGSGIAEISKFNYLLKLVRGKPRDDILGLPHTPEDYEEAKKILTTNYGKDIKVKQALIQELESLNQVMNIHHLRDIHEFYNKLVRIARTLEVRIVRTLEVRIVRTLEVGIVRTLTTMNKLDTENIKRNKIIIEGQVESTLGDSEKSFIKSLFVDVPDNFSSKYQIKHLTLMEFVAPIDIIRNTRSQMNIIKKQNLEKEFINVLYFSWGLVAGSSSEGIINQLLTKVASIENVDQKLFLKNVVTELNESNLDQKTKFKRSLDIICLFLNKEN